jgi:hypothetical protein
MDCHKAIKTSEVRFSNPGIINEVFRGFPQPTQANAEIVRQFGHNLCLQRTVKLVTEQLFKWRFLGGVFFLHRVEFFFVHSDVSEKCAAWKWKQ